MRRSASILVDVLAVLFVVGLVAVVAIPDPKRPAPDPRQTELNAILERVRTGLDQYSRDHHARFPTLESVQVWSMPVNDFNQRTALHRYLDVVPTNPFTNGNQVQGMDAPVKQSDWVYDPASGVFKANDSTANRER